MKIRPVGAELLHTDGRTDMTKLIVAVRNYANASKHCELPSACKMVADPLSMLMLRGEGNQERQSLSQTGLGIRF